MSYARDTKRETYDPRYAEANAEHYSQPGVRWKWQEVVRFMKSVLFDPITGDPTGTDYGNQTGGLRFEASTNRFRYKGGSSTDATVQWRYFGSGDGDVNYFGTEQADNGVARWHSVTKQIQGSVATLDDAGDFSTIGSYRSAQTADADVCFDARKQAEAQPTWRVTADGTNVFGAGASTVADAQLERIGINELGSSLTDAKFSLPTGDSRIKAQRHLGGIGNAQGDSNYRCPIVVAPILRQASTSPGTFFDISETFFTHNIPAAGLSDGDSLSLDFSWSTSASARIKQFSIFVNTTPNISATVGITGGLYAGHVTATLVRQSSSTVVITITGVAGGLVLTGPSADNSAFNNSGDWTNNTYQVQLIGTTRGTGTDTTPADEWIVQGGRLTYFNL